jgi:hypothetical protein
MKETIVAIGLSPYFDICVFTVSVAETCANELRIDAAERETIEQMASPCCAQGL